MQLPLQQIVVAGMRDALSYVNFKIPKKSHWIHAKDWIFDCIYRKIRNDLYYHGISGIFHRGRVAAGR